MAELPFILLVWLNRMGHLLNANVDRSYRQTNTRAFKPDLPKVIAEELSPELMKVLNETILENVQPHNENNSDDGMNSERQSEDFFRNGSSR